ncbi:hypothetical protein ACLI1A_08205 [Flavobacterium sp. RHBU_3]|uniref:hypothetical protein n=1 Tax=Flavobacterium sp. RHBU_3 TaxID=3391184 RepID=UPI0039856296
MNRYYFMLLMILGFVFSSGSSFACGRHHDAVSKFTKTVAAKEDRKQSCCKNTTHSHNCHKHKHGKCGGKCCQCITSGVFKFLPLTVSERNTFFFIPSYKRHVFQYAELFVNADAKGLRLPPKIS